MAQYFFVGFAFEFGVVDFFSRYSVLAALVISAAWFYAGHQYLTEGTGAGFLWQGIGVLFLAAFLL